MDEEVPILKLSALVSCWGNSVAWQGPHATMDGSTSMLICATLAVLSGFKKKINKRRGHEVGRGHVEDPGRRWNMELRRGYDHYFTAYMYKILKNHILRLT